MSMTPEEAIKILKVAKSECEWNAPLDYQEAFDMAISALEKQNLPDTNVGDMVSMQASCVYCQEDSDGYVKPIEKNSHAFIRFGMFGWKLDLSAKGWHGSAKIKYCPMCGRRLNE